MEHPYYQLIGEQIKKARTEAKISQLELARQIGKESSSYIALIESGKRKVSLHNLEKIAKYLQKPFSYFLNHPKEHLDEKEIIKDALLMDQDLNRKQREQILNFYEFIKLYNH